MTRQLLLSELSDYKDRWVDSSKRLPPNNINVIVKVNDTANKLVTGTYIIGHYIPEFFEEYHGDDDWCDYSEERDKCFVKSGWYANTTYIGDDYSSYFITENVIAWRTIPE